METRADYVIVGGFVVALVVGLIVAAFWFARVEFGQHQAFYDIYFKGAVTGLVQGTVVRYNGIPVGRIDAIQLDPQDPSRVRVTVEINTNTVIKKDAVAAIEYQGLTGGAFIEITGGSKAAEPLEAEEDQRYPVIASKQSVLEQVTASFPEVMHKVLEIANQVSDLLNAENRKAIGATLDNISKLTDAAARHSGEIEQAIGDLSVTMHELRETVADARGTLAAARRMVEPGGDASGALRSIDATARKLGAAADQLEALLQENRPGIREFTGRGLNQAEQLLSDARTLVMELTRLAQSLERDPTRILYGERRQGYQPK
jgi:phospholipid/cholesterol/gamma-HCH transport system substrate-binding protein